MNARICLAAALSAVIILGVSPGRAADFGKPGEPVRLVVGYLPYYSGAWSAVVMRGKKMYEKYLPRGSTVEFAVSLQGPKIANAMLSGEQHIGYMGDAPAILAASKPDVADVRLVAVLGLAHDQCNIILVRNDAPRFGSPKEALQWLNGKSVAAPRESCMDRFARQVFREEKVAPAAYLDQNIEVITSGFRAGELDAAVVWEPVASRLVNEGVARRIASGANIDEYDGGFLAMRGDLIRERPDVVTAWLNAELDAQLFLGDPRNASEVVRMATEQTSGFSERDLWSALYGRSSDLEGGTSVRLTLPYVFTPEAMKLLNEGAAFLGSMKSGSEKLKLEAIMPELSERILEKRNLKSPVAEVKALAPQPVLAQAEKSDSREISIRVERGGWGNASPAEIEPVLYSVAKELLSRFPGRPLAPIVVANSSKAPQVLMEKGRGGEYKVLLTAKGKRWGAYVYEFAHELCHVLANYERHPHHKVTADHQWFEEALCEVSSLYTLKNLAPIWDRNPPTPQLAGEAADLRRYADRFLNEAHRKLPPNTTLAAWFKEHQEALRGSPYDRNRNEVVATLLLPLFEENPELWEAIGFLNLDAPGDTFQDYLQNWQDNAPVKYKDVIRYAMTLFYEQSAPIVAHGSQSKFPSRPFEIIVPFGPGGGADGMARKIAQLLQP
ncbi:MAG TPA: ABC transporter substrate-binding protein, partial [Burkholderiales bacterium]|nr:ABC transporter substrate-binding protein [Burkholderiales bacterium]